MPPIVTAILALISAAPTAIVQITNLYETLKTSLTSDDQAVIDKALAAAKISDAAATAEADAALDAAAKR